MLPLVLSGFVGIFLGDTALFLTLNRMGPRRTAMLFSLNAPMSAILGWLLLNEDLSPTQMVGIGLTFLGVLLAIRFGKRKSQLHKWENIKGPVWIGVLLGLAAALSQSVGSLIARPIMETGADPVAASSIRVGVAAVGLLLLTRLPVSWVKPAGNFTLPVVGLIAISGLLGMGLGMTLILFALSGGEVGIIATLSATTPVLMLPMMWWRTGEAPALGAGRRGRRCGRQCTALCQLGKRKLADRNNGSTSVRGIWEPDSNRYFAAGCKRVVPTSPGSLTPVSIV